MKNIYFSILKVCQYIIFKTVIALCEDRVKLKLLIENLPFYHNILLWGGKKCRFNLNIDGDEVYVCSLFWHFRCILNTFFKSALLGAALFIFSLDICLTVCVDKPIQHVKRHIKQWFHTLPEYKFNVYNYLFFCAISQDILYALNSRSTTTKKTI